jgi:hypothetical protein
MPVFSGIDGAVAFTTGYTTKATNWTLDIGVEDVDTSALGETWRSHITGIQEWSGTYEVLTATGIASSTLGGIGVGEAPASATFTLGTGDVFSGTIMITNVSTTAATGSGPTTMTFTFVGSDTLSFT